MTLCNVYLQELRLYGALYKPWNTYMEKKGSWNTYKEKKGSWNTYMEKQGSGN
jgi:hypothetical protein